MIPEIDVKCDCCGEVYRAPVEGGHRLLCGDSTDARAVALLFGEARADCVWTDPPYGVSYVGKTKDALEIQNDGSVGLEALLDGAFPLIDTYTKPGRAVYIAHPAGTLALTFGAAIMKRGWRLHQTLVWVKNSMVLGHSDYHYRHEPIYLAYTKSEEGKGRAGRGSKTWYGDNSQTSVFEIDRPSRSEEHPTQKPVALIEIMLRNSVASDGIVYDPFLGSGSTLMACESIGGLRLFGCEIDPVYADVILRRWELGTGNTAVLQEPAE